MAVVTFYIIAGVTFFFPIILATREFAAKFPITGGSYLWVRSAFGPRFGFLSIWLQWVSNTIWLPTIFTFISSTLASVIVPEWADNQWYILVASFVLFWLITALSARGIKAISVVSTICTVFGTL